MTELSLSQYFSVKGLVDPLWIGTSVVLYDVVSGNTNSKKLLYDYFGLVSAAFVGNMLNNIVVPNSFSLRLKSILRSIITGLLYSYLYVYYLSKYVEYGGNRSMTMAFLIGGLGSWIMGMMANPLGRLWGV